MVTTVAVLACALTALTVSGSPALASDACTAGHNASGQSVSYCGVWVPSGGVPVYASTSSGAGIVDRLHTGGTANWFFCSTSGGSISVNGYTSTNWARTIGDDHSAQGWVPAVYFSGAENYWYGLPSCGGGGSGGGSGCTPGVNQAGHTVGYCAVWLPSGGVPIYAGTSTGTGVVDHLLHGGTVNWFTCQVNGSSVTVGSYSSSNWAKTIGDQSGASGYVPAVYFAGAQNYWPGLPACSDSTPPPTPVSTACAGGHNASGTSVAYCPVWVPSGGVPVYASTSSGSSIVDRLHTGGSANWFYCRADGGTASVGGYSSSSWAKTVGDDHGATGWVPAVYFSGAENYWVGLTPCTGGGGNPSPPPSNGGTPTSGSTTCKGYTVSYTSLPALTLKLVQKACGLSGTYSFGGGHGGTPGPTYGHYDGQDPASLHDDQVLGLDCSGLVRYAYYLTTGNDALNGVTWQQWPEALAMPHNTVIMGGMGSVASKQSQLKVGDILWYGQNADEHVAVYIGNGKQMNAYQSGDPYGVTNVGSSGFWGAVRLW